MAQGFLLSRVLLRLDKAGGQRDLDDVVTQLSAATFTPDGSLWLCADEGRCIDRLRPLAPAVYGEHCLFRAVDFVALANTEEEIDAEALDYDGGYLWLAGSHSGKRKQPKGKKAAKDLERLATVENEANRCLLARIPVHRGELFRTLEPNGNGPQSGTAARLAEADERSTLLAALGNDPHLGRFVRAALPSKDNGLDIEGMTVIGNRVFLGLRGPVLRGYAVILELQLDDAGPGLLSLTALGERPYRKHFLYLEGLGIRDMCRHGDDLLLLAGPTMALEGFLRVYRWRDAFAHDGDSLTGPDDAALSILFELPFTIGEDRAEGLALTCWHDLAALLVVYDDPAPVRRIGDYALLMDLYRLEQ